MFERNIRTENENSCFSLARSIKTFEMFNIPNTFASLLCCSHFSLTRTRENYKWEAATRNIQTKHLMQTVQYRNIANYWHFYMLFNLMVYFKLMATCTTKIIFKRQTRYPIAHKARQKIVQMHIKYGNFEIIEVHGFYHCEKTRWKLFGNLVDIDKFQIISK